MLIIDGHNLIGACKDIKLSDPQAKEKLLSKLKQYQHLTNNKITVVFDGTGFGEFEVFQDEEITVRYPSNNQDADFVIKKMIEKHIHDKSIKVVSSDRELINHTKLYGLISILSNDFVNIINNHSNNNINKKEIYPNNIDADKWLRYFNKDK